MTAFWREGRRTSASMSSTLVPISALASASWSVVVVLPSPSTPLVTAIVRSGRSPPVNWRLVRSTR